MFIHSLEGLMKEIKNMDHSHSIFPFSIPGKGKFTLVLQEMAEDSIEANAGNNPQLEQMIKESQKEYINEKGMSTTQLLKSLSPRT